MHVLIDRVASQSTIEYQWRIYYLDLLEEEMFDAPPLLI
jgi:hypothetical protein